MLIQLLFHIETLIASYFLWQGVYVFTRAFRGDSRHWVNRVDYNTSFATILVSIFMFGVNMEFVSQTPTEYIAWLKTTWWALPLGLGFWFRTIILLPQPEQQQANISVWKNILSIILILWGLAFAPINWFSDFFFAFDDIAVNSVSRFGTYFLPRHFPAYYLHATHFLGTIYLTVLFIGFLWWRTPQNSIQKRSIDRIFVGSIIILIGGSIAAFNYLFWNYRLPQPLGDGISALGLAILGQHLINYNANLQERVLISDYRRSMFSTALLVMAMLIIFHAVHWLNGVLLSYLSIMLLVVTAVLISTLMPLVRNMMNRLVLSRWEAVLFEDMNQIEEKILTAPNQLNALKTVREELQSLTQVAQNKQTQSFLSDEIGKIFRHNSYHKDKVLSTSKLFQLNVVRQRLELFSMQNGVSADQIPIREMCQILRNFLLEQIESLNSDHERGVGASSDVEAMQIEYLILYWGYVHKLSRNEVIAKISDLIGVQLASNGRAYAQHLSNARHRLADQIWLQENAQSHTDSYLPIK